MIVDSINKTWQQLLHPKFKRVFFMGTLLSIVTLVLVITGFFAFWPSDWTTGTGWIDTALSWILGSTIFVVGFFLFPPIARIVMGIMTDDIMDAVEEDYYPHNPAKRKITNYENVMHALKFGLVVIVVNLLALIPYIMLLATGFGTIILYLLINGYLIGREYMEAAAMRHMQDHEVKAFRKRHHSKMMLAGMANAAMFLVPILNLIAPIIGTAVMTHITQQCMEKDRYGAR